MAVTKTQIRRGTSTEVRAMTPASSEVVHDTTNKRLHVGDGSTAAGIILPNRVDILNNTLTYKAAGGTANAITVTLNEAAASYTTGMIVRFKAGATNTAATTINVSGLGTKNIYKSSAGSIGALVGGEIISGGMYEIAYDGMQFQLLGIAPEATSTAGWELLSIATASSSSTLDFTGLTSTYLNYAFVISGLRTSATGVDLLARLSTSSGVFNSSTVYKYLNSSMTYVSSPTGPTVSGAASQTSILFDTSIAARVSEINGLITLHALSGEDAALVHNLNSVDASTSYMSHSTGSGIFAVTSQIIGARFLPSSGNFVSGKIFCYGLRSQI